MILWAYSGSFDDYESQKGWHRNKLTCTLAVSGVEVPASSGTSNWPLEENVGDMTEELEKLQVFGSWLMGGARNMSIEKP